MQAHTHGNPVPGTPNTITRYPLQQLGSTLNWQWDNTSGRTDTTGGGDSQNLQPYSIARTIIKT